jgi:hypothetical protein
MGSCRVSAWPWTSSTGSAFGSLTGTAALIFLSY